MVECGIQVLFGIIKKKKSTAASVGLGSPEAGGAEGMGGKDVGGSSIAGAGARSVGSLQGTLQGNRALLILGTDGV